MAARPPDMSDWYSRQGLQVKGGGITLQAGGAIKGGQTAYATGTGFFLGYSGTAYKFSIGSPTQFLKFDGTNLSFSGALSGATGTFSGALSAATGTFSGSISTSGNLDVSGTANFSGATSSGGKTYAVVAGTGSGVHGGLKGVAGSSAVGLYGTSASTGTAAVVAENTAGGPALMVDGSIQVTNGFGASVAINVQQLMGYSPGNGTGAIPLSNGTVNTNLNADLLDGNHASAFAASGHNHDSTYSALGHNHSGVYVPVSHTSSSDHDARYPYNWPTDSGTAYASSGMNITCTISGYRTRGSSNVIYIEPVSDEALKTNIQPETLGLSFINSLKPVTYTLRGKTRKDHGFVAQDFESLIPEVANKDSLKLQHEDGAKAVDYISLIGPLVKAVQDLSKEVDILTTRINAKP